MSNFRTFGTVAIMIACFAVIYPRFMHPLVLRVFGLYEPPQKFNNEERFPPGYQGRSPPRGNDHMDEMRRNMKHAPHPGMRHAAEMNSHKQSQGSGRGMMGVVLPMYAVGIVCYLLYTLYKVFNKTKNPNAWNNRRIAPGGRGQTNSRGQDRMGFPQDFARQGEGDVREFLHDKRQRKDLEDLLTRADDKNVSMDEMRLLQKRLEETEAQMSRILAAMQGVQGGVEAVAKAQAPNMSSTENLEQDNKNNDDNKDEDVTDNEKKNGNHNEEEVEKEEAVGAKKEEESSKKSTTGEPLDRGSQKGENDRGDNEEIRDDDTDVNNDEDNASNTSEAEENCEDNDCKDEMIPEQIKDEEDSNVRQRKMLKAED